MAGLINWRIGTRLGMGFGAILLALVGIVGLVLVQMQSMATRVQTLADVGVAELVQLNHVKTSIDTRAIAARNLVVDTDPTHAAGYIATIKSLTQDVDRQLQALEDVLVKGSSSYNGNLRKLTAEVRDMERRYVPITLAVAEAVTSNRRQDAADKLIKDCKPLFDQIAAHVGQLEKDIEKATGEQVASAFAASEQARTVVLAVALAVLVGGGLISWTLTRSITGPIAEAVRVTRTVADGDLSTHIDVRRSDELGELLQALKSMNDNLARVVVGVRSASDAIATGTGQIASGNADLSQRTETQASNLQETAASMEQLNTTVRHNAETAAQAAALAGSASTAAQRGGAAVGQVVSTMEEISQSSRKVVDIIAVIDGIAFQTNILALNAAVEAARAGEQGRGFAVVAGEVRVLAQRSAAAAKEIKQLISTSTDRVDQGTRLVSDAGGAMDDIMEQVRRVNDLIEGINQATAQQTAGISQVNSAVAQLDQATQQNAALVEESAAAAESLRQQARQLVDAVGAFRLPSDVVAADSIARAAASSRHTPALPSHRMAAKPKAAIAAPAAGGGDWDSF